MNEPRLEIDDVCLRYRLYTGRGPSVREWLFARLRRKRYSPHRDLWALKNVTLHCRPGDRLGIVGANGAGKTSLLRVIAGVFSPTLGDVRRHGRLVPLLELGLGFNPERTGVENAVSAGVLLGKTRRRARETIPRVFEFAGLEDFADVPLKYYSSGMAARLAFSVAMETDPEILLLDEIFAVGDIHWIARAERRIFDLLDRTPIVVVVSHNLEFLKRICRRGLYLDGGRVAGEGEIRDVVEAYQKSLGPAAGTVIDNRAASSARLVGRVDGRTLYVKATGVPLIGECWIGLFARDAHRDGHLGWRQVSPDGPEIAFPVLQSKRFEVRLYRWTPAGETLEASLDVGPSPSSEEVASA